MKFLRQLRVQGPQVFLVLAGCAAQTVEDAVLPVLLNMLVKRDDHAHFVACLKAALTRAGHCTARCGAC